MHVTFHPLAPADESTRVAGNPIGEENLESARTDPSREQALESALEGKRAQGYRVESQDHTQAVLLMGSRRRFFNLRKGDDERYLLSVDEHGRATSRRIEGVGVG